MPKFNRLSTIASIALVSACAIPPRPAQVTSVSSVVDRVKDELAAYALAPPPQGETDDACRTRPIGLEPGGVVLKLQTASEFKTDPSVGPALSFGVVTLDKPFAATYSNGTTQTIEIPLDPNDVRGAVTDGQHPLAAAMVALRDELNKVQAKRGQCFEIGAIKFTLSFDVVRSVSAGIDLELAGVELSDKSSWSAKTNQTLTVTFKKAGYTLVR